MVCTGGLRHGLQRGRCAVNFQERSGNAGIIKSPTLAELLAFAGDYLHNQVINFSSFQIILLQLSLKSFETSEVKYRRKFLIVRINDTPV